MNDARIEPGVLPATFPRRRTVQANHDLMVALLSVLVVGKATAAEPARLNTAANSPALRIVSRTISSNAASFHNAIYVRPEGGWLRAGANFSEDHGRTWRVRPVTPDFAAGLPHGYRREPVTSLLDSAHSRFLTIVNALDTPGLDPNLIEPPVALETYYLRYRVSTDGGMTWRFDEPIVQAGAFTKLHPFDGVWVGTNSIFLGDAGCLPIVTRRGQILVPAQATLAGPDGKLANPGGGFTYTDVLVLIGQWTAADRISWTGASRVAGDPKRTTRGLIEPTLAEFKDGRILMVMRGSNGGTADPDNQLPGYRWFAVSRDGGLNWSAPEPWTYDDGQPFYSPSAMSTLFRHSSGRCFWIGNLTTENPKGNLPRFPVVLGEVHPRSLKLIRDSVLLVDTEQETDRSQGRLDLSHFTLFEDRETKEIVLVYPRSHHAYKSQEWATVRLAVRKSR